MNYQTKRDLSVALALLLLLLVALSYWL